MNTKDVLRERDNKVDENRMKSFHITKRVHLAEVNIYGDVYFSRYFEWQGLAREEFVRQCLSMDFSSGIKFVTKRANMEYYSPARIFEEILIKVCFTKIKRASLEMRFSIFNNDTNLLLADGRETIVFLNSQNKIIPVPEPIRNVVVNYFESSD